MCECVWVGGVCWGFLSSVFCLQLECSLSVRCGMLAVVVVVVVVVVFVCFLWRS